MKGTDPEQPERLGHPDGFADERNYFKLVLAPLGLWGNRWPVRPRGAE